MGSSPWGATVSPDGSTLYVANNATGDRSVSVINTATNAVIGSRIPVGTNLYELAVSPADTRLYVANGAMDSVSVIDTATRVVVGTPITVGDSRRE